jgi:cytoskeleton protein RodZ
MSDRPEPGGVGARLRRVREGQRVTLRQIANVTKISVAALDAIERDEVGKLPGGIFARAFVRAYATELGLDAERTVEEYFAQFPVAPEMIPPQVLQMDDAGRAWQERLPAGLWRGVALLLPGLALVAWMVVGARMPAGRTAEPLAAPPIPAVSPEVRAPAVLRSVADVVPAGGPLPAPEGAGLTLHLTARSECWVSVTADGREVVSRLMGAGEDAAVRAESELRVKVGDAAAVTLHVNGSPLRPLGSVGQVVTLRLDPDSLHDWLATP